MPLERGSLVYVMGPSGAGKDSVLRFARANIDRRERVVFAHRYITRPADATGENHIALTRTEFELRKSAGLFAFDWQAHDTCYGIGIEVRAWSAAGCTIVMNGSRNHYATLAGVPDAIVPIVITAPPEILARRLAGRGRESETQIVERLRRDIAAPNDPATIVIDNLEDLEVAGRRFLDVLRRLAHRQDAA